MSRKPRMSEDMYNRMKSFFTHILLNANDEQALKIADAIGELAAREIERLEKEIVIDSSIN